MGSPVTFSGFNNIDWGMILDAVIAQESAPLTELETQQQRLQKRSTTYSTLATKLSAFQSAVDALAGKSSITGRSTANTDTAALSVSASGTAAVGIYDIVVQDLARAQVTAAASFPPDPDQTTVAWSGALTIGGVAVVIDAPVTLQGLADRINSTADVPVTASVIRAAASSYQLVLTGKATGAAAAFTIENTLSGGTGITFGANAVDASDARVLINNVTATSETNTIADAIPGVTLSLLRKSPDSTATVTVSEDLSATKGRIQKLVDTFNDIIKFSDEQQQLAARRDPTSIARDPLLTGLRSVLRQHLSAEYEAGGTIASLSTIGIEFDRTGKLTFNAARFEDKSSEYLDEIRNLFSATGTEKGVFTQLQQVIKGYTASDGLLRDMQNRINDQTRALTRRMADLEERLVQRRNTLQKEYIATDMAMSRMNSAIASLSSIGSQYRLF